MQAHRAYGLRRAAANVVLLLMVVAAAASLLPLIETNAWWIRYLDFPRLQLAVGLLVLGVLYLALRPRPGPGGWIGLALAVVGLGYHAYKLHPYSAFAAEAAAGLEACADASTVRVMVANVQKRNEQAEAFLALVAEADPDLLLVMETDAWWDRHLAPLRDRFAHRVQSIPEQHAFYGMHLFSKLELVSPEFRSLFGAPTPTIFTHVRLPDGTTVQFLGLHPQPPLAWSQPTTMRDAHLLSAALEAAASGSPTIVAGDFNAAPWERVTRRAIRLGGLLDPRIGRGYFATYDAQSLLVSWPIDQILFEDELALMAFERLPAFGSDHYPVLAELCHAPMAATLQAAPKVETDDREEAERAIEAARAMAPGG